MPYESKVCLLYPICVLIIINSTVIVICCLSHFFSHLCLLRNMQEVQLDKHVKLLDSPGIVMDANTSDVSIILRNCVKVWQERIFIN